MRARRNLLFVPPDAAAQATFSSIANYVRATYEARRAADFLAKADPWVIAHAAAYGGAVVTLEARVPSNSSKIKIPNVCDHFNIRSMGLYQMLRELGASFHFEARHRELERLAADPESDWYEPDTQLRFQIAEDRDAYIAENIFRVPPEARWSFLQARAKQPDIGRLIDDAMVAIESENPPLKGVLPKDYGSRDLDKQLLGELLDLIGTIGLGDDINHSRDILGRVYEYFLGRFAGQEGKSGGDYYTPRSVVRLLVEMIQPYPGRIYDPCCGSGGMFVQSERFIEEHGGRVGDLSIYGQESNPTTWRLARMNLAIRGIEANLGRESADTSHNDLHRDLRADFILANPHFNDSDWGGERLWADLR